MSKIKAIFIDRDGVINIEKNYLYKSEDFDFIDGVFDALRYLELKGYKLFLITNQSGINRGYYTIKDFQKLTKWMLGVFQKENIKISGVEFCPHMPKEGCNCGKPKTGMIDSIMNKYEIDIASSWLIGDKNIDIECAENAGIKNTIQVRSGHYFDENESKSKYIITSLKNINEVI